jgi:hypothetical protein
MPQIAAEDVNACRQAPMRRTSPTEELLRIWGTKGYSVLQLYKVLAKVKHVRAMKIIRHLGSFYLLTISVRFKLERSKMYLF